MALKVSLNSKTKYLIPLAALLWFLWPAAALAQEPVQCVDPASGPAESSVDVWFDGASMPADTRFMTGPEYNDLRVDDGLNTINVSGCGDIGEHVSGQYAQAVGCDGGYKISIIYDAAVDTSEGDVSYNVSVGSGADDDERLMLYCEDDSGTWNSMGPATFAGTIPQGTQCNRVALTRSRGGTVPRITNFSASCPVAESTPTPTPSPTPTTTPPPVRSCSLVPHADFESTGTWLLAGTAAITNSAVTLVAPGDSAAQNLNTIESNTTYEAVIEVSQVSGGSVGLDVILGSDSSTLNLSTAGSYSTTFTTGEVGGGMAFGLEHVSGSGTAIIDYACLSKATGGGQYSCIAPANGEFTTADGWDYHRSAAWAAASENVLLPASDQGLIQDTNAYTLPTIAAEEYLLLSYEARRVGNTPAQIASAAVADFNDATNYFEVFEKNYTFEADISPLAGGLLTALSFANASDDAYTADLVLDNVCVYVSNDPPQLPYPTDPAAITPIAPPGTGISSCSDVDGIWAGFGVNMAYYRTVYAGGVAIWDPSGWVPWLGSAIFVTLADWSCMFMAAYLSLLNAIVHIINNIMNIFAWVQRSATAIISWFSQWFFWAHASAINILEELEFYTLAWGDWWIDLFQEIPPWLLLFPPVWGAWLMNQLLALFYEFVGGWNGLMEFLALFYSSETGEVNDQIFALINDYVPGGSFLSFILWLVTEVVYQFINFVWAVGEMIYWFLHWLWENVISVGHIPLNFYYAFDAGIEANSFGSLVSCASYDFWCAFLGGVQIVNQTSSHTIIYPMVITVIIVSTVVIVWRNIQELFDLSV